MDSSDYVELEKRAEVVKEGHKRTMDDLSAWEKNIAETVEQRIKEAAIVDD